MNRNEVIDLNCIAAPEQEPQRQRFFMEKCKELIREREEKLGRKLTFFDQTFGCQMNFKDSEKLNGILEEIGYVPTDSENADFVYYNTCTVRENANARVYGRLGTLKTYKKKNPDMVIASIARSFSPLAFRLHHGIHGLSHSRRGVPHQ